MHWDWHWAIGPCHWAIGMGPSALALPLPLVLALGHWHGAIEIGIAVGSVPTIDTQAITLNIIKSKTNRFITNVCVRLIN